MGHLAEFKLLLWKNYLLQRRKVLVTFLEIGLPTFFALILIFIRQRIDCTFTNATSWTEFAVNQRFRNNSWMSSGPWQIYFTPNTTAERIVMKSAVEQLNRLCENTFQCPVRCVSGQ